MAEKSDAFIRWNGFWEISNVFVYLIVCTLFIYMYGSSHKLYMNYDELILCVFAIKIEILHAVVSLDSS